MASCANGGLPVHNVGSGVSSLPSHHPADPASSNISGPSPEEVATDLCYGHHLRGHAAFLSDEINRANGSRGRNRQRDIGVFNRDTTRGGCRAERRSDAAGSICFVSHAYRSRGEALLRQHVPRSTDLAYPSSMVARETRTG